MGKKRPRLADVARLAGVSEATASVVINSRVGESARVSPATQERVWAAVHKLGYVANPLARNLAGGRNHIIAVFTFESVFPLSHGNFFYPFLIGIEEEAARQGYDLLLITRTDSKGHHRIHENGVNRLQLADGAILLGYGDRQEVYALLEEQFPFVFVGRRESPRDDISYSAGDYIGATVEVVRHLFGYGHRHIAYVQTNRTDESSSDRAEGFAMAHREFGFTAVWWRGEHVEFSEGVVLSLLNQGVTAFVLEDDSFGKQLQDHARTLNRLIPEDFSMAVLGDPLIEFSPEHTWTHYKVPRLEMGRKAVMLLMRILNEPRESLPLPLRVTIPCLFYAGDTVAHPPVQQPGLPPPLAGV